MNKVFTAIGLMSGTSCDGVDASIIQSDGEDQLELIKNHYIPYDNETKNEIINIKRKINDSKDLKENSKILSSLEKKKGGSCVVNMSYYIRSVCVLAIYLSISLPFFVFLSFLFDLFSSVSLFCSSIFPSLMC